jgi:Polyketide cyclase / dehydrase and lipid transport
MERSHTLTTVRSLHTPSHPAAVMALLMDPATWPRWQSEIVSASGPSPVGPGEVARGKAHMLGFQVDGHSTTLEAGDAHFEQDVIVGVRMRIRYEVAASGSGSVLTHSLVCELPAGVSGRVLSFFLRRRLRRLQRSALERLAALTTL